jgi:chromosome segregation ATPase
VPVSPKRTDQVLEQLQAEVRSAHARSAGLTNKVEALSSQLQQVQDLLAGHLRRLEMETAGRGAASGSARAVASKTKAEADRRITLETQLTDLRAKGTAETDTINGDVGRSNSEATKAKLEGDRRVAADRQLADLRDRLATELDAKRALIDRADSEAAKAKAEAERRATSEKRRANVTARLKIEAAKTKELQEENDLLLAQLHQVQEELERYYLKNKDLESSVGEVTTSLRNARYALINAKLTGTLAPQKLLPSN